MYLFVMKMQHSNYNKMFNYSVWNTVFYVVEEIQTLSSKTYGILLSKIHASTLLFTSKINDHELGACAE